MILKKTYTANLPKKAIFKSKKEIAPGVFSFTFQPIKPLTWEAGQHVTIYIKGGTKKNRKRTFSVSSAPSENLITITTRMHSPALSPFKQHLKKLKKGAEISFRGPTGPLITKDETQKYVFLATGIGITPFRAILKEMEFKKSQTKVTLIFAGNKENHFFRDELSEINAKMKNLTIRYIYKPERLTGQTIEEELKDAIFDSIFFLTGSQRLVKSYRRTLLGLGVKNSKIKDDTFAGYHPHKAIEKETISEG